LQAVRSAAYNRYGCGRTLPRSAGIRHDITFQHAPRVLERIDADLDKSLDRLFAS